MKHHLARRAVIVVAQVEVLPAVNAAEIATSRQIVATYSQTPRARVKVPWRLPCRGVAAAGRPTE